MRIVWTNGCFDIMHPGHIELFKACKTLGDRLIVFSEKKCILINVGQDIEFIADTFNYLGVRHDRLVGLLVESVKEQQEQIDELKKEVEELKNDSS